MTQLVNEQDTPVIAKTKELCEALIAQDSYKALKAKFLSKNCSSLSAPTIA